MSRRPILAITLGDPGGVGPEITLKVLSRLRRNDATILLVGPISIYEEAAKSLKLKFRVNRLSSFALRLLAEHQINLLDIPLTGGTFKKGIISKINGRLSLESLKVAAYLASSGLVDGIVTAPVNKSAVRLVVPSFIGHTEYLAKVSHTKRFAMMFVDKKFRVTLATTHLPLRKVPSELSKSLILGKIVLTGEALRRFFGVARPKIAVCALNPHGGEFGSEEARIIQPAVRSARKKGFNVTGPLPADQLFYELFRGNYDAAVSMYHDQGLGPFKMIAFKTGVNCTLGLPFVRTSPDHGTAFGVAYRNKADSSSMEAAISLALRMVAKIRSRI
ncbi:MAG: 4-hydroxythreonine-4-phosphate dehydrogenase PdxA [Candidatus Omnitrophica bacterium]|nr:4-hydroxythreonine-4-phosphate dehydrogenase PdxA [Candidatus Omnitrophota bacterium]